VSRRALQVKAKDLVKFGYIPQASTLLNKARAGATQKSAPDYLGIRRVDKLLDSAEAFRMGP
jgi:hypothetical protein